MWYILGTILFVVLSGLGLFNAYKSHVAEQNDLSENYIKTEAEITFVGITGIRHRARTLLFVAYQYHDSNYSGKITRPYKWEGYYNKGDRIMINLNPNNPEEIR
jgi:hypothetical protein